MKAVNEGNIIRISLLPTFKTCSRAPPGLAARGVGTGAGQVAGLLGLCGGGGGLFLLLVVGLLLLPSFPSCLPVVLGLVVLLVVGLLLLREGEPGPGVGQETAVGVGVVPAGALPHK